MHISNDKKIREKLDLYLFVAIPTVFLYIRCFEFGFPVLAKATHFKIPDPDWLRKTVHKENKKTLLIFYRFQLGFVLLLLRTSINKFHYIAPRIPCVFLFCNLQERRYSKTFCVNHCKRLSEYQNFICTW